MRRKNSRRAVSVASDIAAYVDIGRLMPAILEAIVPTQLLSMIARQ
jgi:hypothetical protein